MQLHAKVFVDEEQVRDLLLQLLHGFLGLHQDIG